MTSSIKLHTGLLEALVISKYTTETDKCGTKGNTVGKEGMLTVVCTVWPNL